MKKFVSLIGLLLAVAMCLCPLMGAVAELADVDESTQDSRQMSFSIDAYDAQKLYENFMASTTLEELYYDKLWPACENSSDLLSLFTDEQIIAIGQLANTIYAAVEDPDAAVFYQGEDKYMTVTELHEEIMAVLANVFGEYDWAVMGSWADDMTLTANMSIDSEVSIKDNDEKEANWKFDSSDSEEVVTLTINATVTIPKGESLDIIVAQGGKVGYIEAGTELGDQPMFRVEDGGHLKIGYSKQTHNSIRIIGGIIEVEQGGMLTVGEIDGIYGDATWDIQSTNPGLRVAGDIPIYGSLKIVGNDRDTSLVRTLHTNDFTGSGEQLTANGKWMFTIEQGASLSIENVTVDGGAVWESGNEHGLGRGTAVASGLDNVGFVSAAVQAQDSSSDQFSANNCVFQNFNNDGKASPVFTFKINNNVKFVDCLIKNCQDSGSSGSGLIRLQYRTDDDEKAYPNINEPNPRTALFKKVTFEGCASSYSTDAGGLIRTNGTTNVNMTIDQCTFKNNYSGGWGNILWNAYGSCNITNSSFISNSARLRGGAISSEGQGLSIENCTFDGNHAGELGGAVGMFTYTLASKDNDYGDNGITINTRIENCTFKNNSAKQGGAVAVYCSASASTKKTTIDTIIGNGTVFQKNSAENQGGAIYIGSVANAKEDGNAQTALLASKNILTVTGGTFGQNTALYGGAVYIDDSRTNPTTKNSIHVSGGVIGGSINGSIGGANTATNGGGAIYVNNGHFTMSGGTVSENISNGNGGAAYVSGGNFTMTSGTLSSNTATADGGAVYVTGGEVVIGVQNCSDHAHPVLTGNSAANGGAIAVADSTPKMYCGTMTGNRATGNGGAVYVSGGGFEMVNGTLGVQGGGNSATKGGAVYASGGSFTMDDGVVSYNTATSGGAVYVAGTSADTEYFTMSNGTMSNNAATSNGGAVYVATGSVQVTNGTFTGNAATGDGGAVYVSKGHFTMDAGSITGSETNSATNGGAAYITGGNFTMKSGTVSGHKVTNNGGAVYVHGGSAVVENGVLNTNTAQNGGAVYVDDGNFTMYSGEMEDNTVSQATTGNGYGGAVCITKGTIVIGVNGCPGSDTNHTNAGDHNGKPHPQITENEAIFGGALAVRQSGKVYIYCGQIVSNTSDGNGTGMNVFIDGEDSVFTQYDDSSTIGADDDHGLVITGGTLTIIGGEYTTKITLVFDPNSDSIITRWSTNVPDGYTMNLPYCPQSWQSETDGTFVGWTAQPLGADVTSVRKREDYFEIGEPVLLEGGDDQELIFYAVWAPRTNYISYQYVIDDGLLTNGLDEFADFNGPSEYAFKLESAAVPIGAPDKDGYRFLGWRMYANSDTKSNWDADPSTYEYKPPQQPKKLADLPETGCLGNNTLSTQQSFGNITLVAVFEAQFAKLTINKAFSGVEPDDSLSYLFHVTGKPLSSAYKPVDMYVTIQGDGSTTLAELPVGYYSVTEMNDWSWRYTDQTAKEAAVLNPSEATVVTFTNTLDPSKTKWLDDEYGIRNDFGDGTVTILN